MLPLTWIMPTRIGRVTLGVWRRFTSVCASGGANYAVDRQTAGIYAARRDAAQLGSFTTQRGTPAPYNRSGCTNGFFILSTGVAQLPTGER